MYIYIDLNICLLFMCLLIICLMTHFFSHFLRVVFSDLPGCSQVEALHHDFFMARPRTSLSQLCTLNLSSNWVRFWLGIGALLGTNISPLKVPTYVWVDDFPDILRWDMDSFPGGYFNWWCFLSWCWLLKPRLPKWQPCLHELPKRGNEVCVISMCVLILAAYSSQVPLIDSMPLRLFTIESLLFDFILLSNCGWKMHHWGPQTSIGWGASKPPGAHGSQGGCGHHFTQRLCHHGQGGWLPGWRPGEFTPLLVVREGCFFPKCLSCFGKCCFP